MNKITEILLDTLHFVSRSTLVYSFVNISIKTLVINVHFTELEMTNF